MNDTQPRTSDGLVAVVMTLCVIACLLILLLPADSLVTDLIYQGF